MNNINNNNKPRIFENIFDKVANANEHIYSTSMERELLIHNHHHHHHQQQQQLLNNNSFFLNKNSPFKPLKQQHNNLTLNTTSSTSSSSSSSNLKTNQAVSYMTKTSLLNSTASPTNIYYETPNYMNLNSIKKQIYHSNNNNNNNSTELAYDVADALNIFSKEKLLLNNYNSADVCIGLVGASGGKLQLECGLSLIIPDGALLADQSVTMYLALNRLETYKPKLNDKNTLLTDIVLIGPQDLTLCKPVILIMEHCLKNVNQDWMINLYSAFNSIDDTPDWLLDQNITYENTNNLNVFLNATETNFFLMTDRLGRFCLTGEAHMTNMNNACLAKASKYFRLVTFGSSCISSNGFNLRIYCVDNLLTALQVGTKF